MTQNHKGSLGDYNTVDLKEIFESLPRGIRVSRELSSFEKEGQWADSLLLVAVTRRLEWYLKNNLEECLQIFYRMDVNEQKLKQLFSFSAPEELPKQMAELLIQRQLQKLQLGKRVQFPPD